MDNEKLREMEWFVEFERKFGISPSSQCPKPFLVSPLKDMTILCTNPSNCVGLVNTDNERINERAILILSADILEPALKMFKSLKLGDSSLLIFKKDFPAVLYSTFDKKGVMIAPKILMED